MRQPVAAYLLSLAAVVVAVVLRWALDPLLGDKLPFVTLFGAVAAAAWVGGWRPATLGALLGYAAVNFLFIAPRGALGLRVTADLVGLLAYAFTCALVIGFGEAMRVAQRVASEGREVLQVTLRSIGDAVITTDTDGRITYLNSVAERLTGWTLAEARGQALDTVFRIVNETTRQPVANPVARALREGIVVGLANHTILIRQDGGEMPIDDSAAPIRDSDGRVTGSVLIFRDVSAQRRMERERTTQLMTARTLAAIVESSDDAIVSKTLDGTIRSWNSAAERVFGWTADEAIGRHISLVIPRERIAEEDAIVERLAAGQPIDHFETERVTKNGRRIKVSLTISPLKDESGKVVGASKIARDVTLQRDIEALERRLLADAAGANAKLRALFDQSEIYAAIIEPDGNVIDPNRVAAEGCGYARDQIVGRKFWDGPWWAPSPDTVEQVRAACGLAAAGETFRAELPYFVADGSERIADITILPIRNESARVIFLAATGVDITERKRAQAERERFATVIENSTDFIGICDMNGVPFFVNRAGLAMVGLDSLDEATKVGLKDFFFPEDQPLIVDTFLPSVLQNGHGEIEVRFRNFKTGDARWMTYKVLVLKNARGRPVAFATVSQDITERKRMEDNLRQLADELVEADRRKDAFIATLAHELRNPLAPLANMIEVMKRAQSDPDTLERARATMERQLAQMVRLVDDLLDLNRISHDRLELRRTNVELQAVIGQAIEASRPLLDSAGHRLSVSLPDAPIHLHADPARLAQVFGNLLHNSCKYTNPGGHIWVSAERRGDQAIVSIRDNGTGIPPDKLQTIFEMFTQVDRPLERAQGGLGIGLTLVQRLVQMHGGSIEASSAGENRGSEFTVRLPVVAQLSAEAPDEPAKQAATARHRILIVDDNQDSAESLAMLLSLSGNETFMANDGEEAIAAAEAHRPDIMLLDIGMPKLNGHDVCRYVRRQPWGKDIMTIALTGWGQEEDRRRSHDAGFDGHLVKPVDYNALQELLASIAQQAS